VVVLRVTPTRARAPRPCADVTFRFSRVAWTTHFQKTTVSRSDLVKQGFANFKPVAIALGLERLSDVLAWTKYAEFQELVLPLAKDAGISEMRSKLFCLRALGAAKECSKAASRRDHLDVEDEVDSEELPLRRQGRSRTRSAARRPRGVSPDLDDGLQQQPLQKKTVSSAAPPPLLRPVVPKAPSRSASPVVN
jgi:hypothetical protein